MSSNRKHHQWKVEGRNSGGLIPGRKVLQALHRGGSSDHRGSTERESGKKRKRKSEKHVQGTTQENCSPKSLTGEKGESFNTASFL